MSDERQSPVTWADLPLTAEHAAYLETKAAITPTVAGAAGIHSATTVGELPEWAQSWDERATPAIVFPYRSPDGLVVEQVKPDQPILYKDEVKPRKYLFEEGSGSLLNAVRVVPDGEVSLIVEGTKQTYAAASWAPEGVSVYGIAGCRNWSQDGVPIPTLSVFDGQKVVIILDGDAATNFEVYDAGSKLADVLADEGAAEVRFGRINAGKKTGLDDLVVTKDAARRTDFLVRIIERALVTGPAGEVAKARKPADRKPAAKARPAAADDDPGARFFGDDGLLVADLSEAVRDHMPAALTQERKVALYRGGVFHIDGTAFSGAVARLLGNRFRPGHRAAVEEYTVGMLHEEDLVLPIHTDYPMTNVSNGMLDLPTSILKPHDPIYLSGQQIPVTWDADAKCPTYERWIELCGLEDQIDDLEETASTMLDPSRTPPKAVFLFGPSRSGKSTFLRVMQGMVGPHNMSAVTLHQLSQNRFAAANVFGKMLNCAADLSAAHVEDISIFKMMTGEDPIQADRKYGSQFAFTNRALFAFSANELPTVGESSRAYIERIKPFEFGRSFAGRENPNIEAAMMGELPGILVRWVRAWQRRADRGTYLPTDSRVLREFETRSDRVRQWLDEQCRVWTVTSDGRPILPGTTVDGFNATEKTRLAREFNRWAEDNNGSKMGQRKILDRLSHIEGVVEVRFADRKRALNITIRDDHGDEECDTPGPFEGPGSYNGQTGKFEPQNCPPGPEIDREDAQVTDRGEEGRAERASSTPTVASSPETYARQVQTLVTQGVEGVCSPTVSVGCSEIARSAREGVNEPAPTGQLALVPDPQQTAEDAHPEYTAIDLFAWTAEGEVDLPEGVVVFDIESAGNELWPIRPGFIRITGVQEGKTIRVYDDAEVIADLLSNARLIVGHNIMGFDLLAFALHHGVDLHKLAADGRIIDTMLTEIVTNPPEARTKQGQIMKEYSLDTLGLAKFGQGKTGDLDALAKEFGGYDRIPIDDERYVRYCAGDVNLAARIAASQRRTEYAKREHRVAAIAAQIRVNGFRVDEQLLAERVAAGHARRAELVGKLRDRYGLPTTKKDGKPSKSPQATAEGRAAIVQAFVDLGVTLPTTPSGQPALGKEALVEVAGRHANDEGVQELVETVQSLNGVRSVYDTVARCRVGDRVHPDITMFQASGRWSITEPGLTVMGKRGGKYVEREIFIPEEGHVVIAADLAQVDARAVAAWCQDPAYLELFQPGRDSHTEIALAVWRDASRRDDAKIIGHGWNYGMGLGKLADKCGSLDAAQEFDRAMRDRFPGLVDWKRRVAEEADAGRLLDNGFGRLLRTTPGYGWTQGPALLGQSAARDILMEGLLRMPRELHPYLRAVVHDEIVLSIPVDQADELERAVLAALSFEWCPHEGGIPVRIEAGLAKRGDSWGACYAK
jgi:P4 family phage/plasmid primase-like protien